MLARTETIDLVAFVESEQLYELIAVVERDEWERNDVKHLLQEKTNSYLIYALDGQLLCDHPDASNCRIEMRIQSIVDLPDQFRPFFDQLRRATAARGVILKFDKL